MQPAFLCIGFQKCGTTTMYDLLRQHRGIVLTRDVKEPMYYRVKGFRAIGGKQWYENRYFGHIRPGDTRVCGEINAGLAFTHCAEKIGADFPRDTKLIFMMRNPVDRCYSAYKYFGALGFLPMADVEYDLRYGHAEGFDHYVRRVLDDPYQRSAIMKKRLKYLCFSQGNYSQCIQEFLRYFPRENMKFIVFEEFVRDQQGVCRALYDFLGVDDDPTVQYDLRSNEGVLRAASPLHSKIRVSDGGIHYFFHEFLDLSRRLPSAYRWYDTMHRKLQSKCIVEETDFSGMKPETRARLEQYYRRQVRGVEKLMHRDLHEIWFA